MSCHFDKPRFAGDDSRQIDIALEEFRAQVVRRSLIFNWNYFRQMRRDLIGQPFDVRARG